MHWYRGIRDGVALVRLARKKSPISSAPVYYYLDPSYAGSDVLKRETVVTITGAGLGCFLVMILPLIFAAVVLIVGEYNRYLFAVQARETGAIVTDCAASGTDYTLSYRFDVQRQSYTNSDRTGECLPSGTSISIWYIPANPTRSQLIRPAQSVDPGPMILAGVIAFLLIAVWLYNLFLRFRQLQRFERLSQSSVRLPGTLINVRLKTFSRGASQLVVQYEFIAPDGRTLSGQQATTRYSYPLPETGIPVQILYADERAYVML